MKLYTLILMVIFTSLLSLNTSAQSLTKSLREVMQATFSPDAPGAALLVVKDGKVVIEEGFGLANLKTWVKITPTTNFRMASVSKQFTAMSIMLLVDDKKISLKDPLSKFFPQLPPASANIKVRQLLTHTSGIWDYESLMPGDLKTQLHDSDVLIMVEKKDSTYFVPGSQFRYSNTGYCLLSLIVEKASGIPYASFVNKRIFNPLRMAHSSVYDADKEIPNRAYGYHFKNKAWHFADQSLTSATLGDGGIYTSLKEYRRWSDALDAGTLLSSANMKMILSPEAKINEKASYGFGWFLTKEDDGTDCRYHSGESTGFHNIVFRNPAHKLLIVLFTNRDDDSITEAFGRVAAIMGVQLKNATGDIPLFHWLSGIYGG